MIILDAVVTFIIMKLFPGEQTITFLGIMCMVTFLRMSGKISLWLNAFEEGLNSVFGKKEQEEEI